MSAFSVQEQAAVTEAAECVVIGGATLYRAECIALMRALPDSSVDAIVTDPPYHLTNNSGGPAKGSDNAYSRSKAGATSTGFMGQAWDGGDIAFRLELWTEALRVLKPGGHLLAFSGTRTQHRMVCAIEDAGFVVRDQIGWAFGSGFPKSRRISADMTEDADDWDGWGTALKPAWEPICVARKPLAKGHTVAANVLAFGTGAINIDGCRIEPTGESRARIGEASQDQRCTDAGNTNFAATPGVRGGAPEGRWPANLVHDGSDEVVALFPAQAGASAPVRGTEASAASVGRVTGARERVAGAFHGDSGSASRFFYCAKASRTDRNAGLTDPGPQFEHGATLRAIEDAPKAGNIHPTVKPTDLMAYLCRLVTPPGGVVLDPFMGSGSTGKAAMREGFRFIGIEIGADYFPIAVARIQHEIDAVAAAVIADAAAAKELARQADLFAEREA